LGVLDIVAPSRDEFDLLNDAAALSVFARQNDIRTVVHLANPRIYSTNTSVGESLSALRNVLEVSASIGAGFFFASGWEVFSGYRVRELIAPNDLTPRPRGPYGEAKALAEQLIAWFLANHGLRSAVLRLSPVYGHGVARPKFIYNFIHKALAGEPIQTHRYRNGEPRLALLHVTDAGAGILGAHQQQISGVLNLGGEALVSTSEVARFIVDRLDSASPLDSVHVDADWANVLLDNDPASDRLGWRPRISWQQGLASIIDGELQRHRDREKSE
jgi:nucleoside-diphosphate-sugar epimerase